MAFTDEDPDVDEVAAAQPDPVAEADPDEPAVEVPDPPVTGDPAVDEVVAALARAVTAPLEEQLTGYDSAYRTLQDRLADVEG
jgi:hypothetical protein